MAAESSVVQLKPNPSWRALLAASEVGSGVCAFANFTFDLSTCELRRDGSVVTLRRCLLRLLAYLVQRAGSVVSRRELFEHLWPGVAVTNGSLTQSIWELRRVLEEGSDQRMIRTSRGVGYCFTAAVRRARDVDAVATAALPRARPLIAVVEAVAQLGGASPSTRPCQRPPAPRYAAASGAEDVAELGRLLHARAQVVPMGEPLQQLIAAYNALIPLAQQLGLTELEIDARLGRAACLLRATYPGADTTDASRPAARPSPALRSSGGERRRA